MAFALNRVTLGFFNRIEEGAVTGPIGSWNPAFPVTRVQDRVYNIKARTLSALDTQIVVSLPKQRRVGAVSFHRHNLTNAAKWRYRIYYDAARTILLYESGWLFVWPQIYAIEDVDYEGDNYWTRNIANEDRTDYIANAIGLADQNYITGAVVIDISDAYNADGVFRVGRVALMEVFQPETNRSYGVQWGAETGTTIESVRDETEYFDVKPSRRTVTFALERLTEDEAFGRAYRAMLTHGIDREILFADTLTVDRNSPYKTFMARFQQTSALTHPNALRHAWPVTLTEYR